MGGKIESKFQNLTVAKKLLVLSLVVSIGPIFCILIINYQLSAKVVKSQIGKLTQAKLEQNAVNMENFYRNCERIIQEIYWAE